jgi:hypothetical protein
VNPWLAFQFQVLAPEIRDFLNPRPGVVKEQKEGSVAQG